MLSVNRLEYMAACFEEGMRMYPAIPTGLPRRVPDCGAIVCGRWVPAKVCTTRDWRGCSKQRNANMPMRRHQSLSPIGQLTALAAISGTQTPSCLNAGWAIRCMLVIRGA